MENKIIVLGMLDIPGAHEMARRVYSTEGICRTISRCCGGGHEPKILVKYENNSSRERSNV